MEFLTHPIVQGALIGMVTAASVDFAAFRAWKTWSDGLTYDWRVASFRWFQGAVVGAVAKLGLGWM